MDKQLMRKKYDKEERLKELKLNIYNLKKIINLLEITNSREEDKNVLEHLISVDDGARMLGEVALVPYSSPINQTNILFYETLYDENACCHLALGRAFNECIKDFDKMTDEEIEAFDLNKSIIHVDFMIGSSDLSIKAKTYDGKLVDIFKNGEWA